MASLKKQLEIESKSGADLGAGHSVCMSDVHATEDNIYRVEKRGQNKGLLVSFICNIILL